MTITDMDNFFWEVLDTLEDITEERSNILADQEAERQRAERQQRGEGEYSLEFTLNMLETEDEYIDRRHKERLDNCGNLRHSFNVHTGLQHNVPFNCDYFRECEYCANARADEELKRNFKIKSRMLYANGTRKEIDKFIRKYNLTKDRYMRYPQEGEDRDILIIGVQVTYQIDIGAPTEKTITSSGVSDDVACKIVENGGERIDRHWLTEQNWITITRTPEDRHKSGLLNMPESTAPEKDIAFIDVHQVVTDAPANVINATMNAIIDQTIDMAPKTPGEVELFLQKRSVLFMNELASQGYEFLTYICVTKVKPSQIDWQLGIKSRNIKVSSTRKSTSKISEVVVWEPGDVRKIPKIPDYMTADMS